MGNTRVHVLFVRVHAHVLPLDATSCTFFAAIPNTTSQLLQGIVICVTGLGLLVACDQITNKNWTALDKGKGDLFMIIGATLYGFSTSCTVTLTHSIDGKLEANATEEFFVRRYPLYEVLGQLGMWGMIINGVQASILEHKKMRESTWNGANRMSPHLRFGVSRLLWAFELYSCLLTRQVRIFRGLHRQHDTYSHRSDVGHVYRRATALSSCLFYVLQSELALRQLLRFTFRYVTNFKSSHI